MSEYQGDGLWLQDRPLDKFGVMESLMGLVIPAMDGEVVCSVSMIANGPVSMNFNLKRHEVVEIVRALRVLDRAR
jgi:hypothetical protein